MTISYLYLTQIASDTTIPLKQKKDISKPQFNAKSQRIPHDPCLYQEWDQIKQFTNNELSDKIPIPFPPYAINENHQFLLYISSIFCTLIGNKSFSELKQSELLKWLYYYRTNYPYMPNIYDLYQILSIKPNNNPQTTMLSFNRYILHKFCEKFSSEFKFTLTEFTAAIPRRPNAIRNINTNLLIFMPILSPISSFDQSTLTIEPENKRQYIPFPTKLNISNGKDNDPKNTQNEIYKFFGGIFQSTKTGENFAVLICPSSPNQPNFYYKYSTNCALIKQSPEIMYKSNCKVAFFVKSTEDLNLIHIYQKIDKASS